MALMNGVAALGYLTSMKKLFFLHFGSQIKAQFDNDFPPLIGPEGLKETVQMFWMLDQVGWKGVVEFDCHMLRTDADPDKADECRRKFVRNCCNALTITIELAARLKGNWMKGLTETEADLTGIMRLCELDSGKIAAKTESK
jgi:xylose isomerase